MRLRRIDAGAYLYVPRDDQELRYRIERGWHEAPAPSASGPGWVLLRMRPRPAIFDEYDVEILSDHPTLAAARAELARILA